MKVEPAPAEGGKEETSNDQPPTAAQVAAKSIKDTLGQVAKEVNDMKTPNGGIKKTKQQRKEALFKKKRLRSVLTHKV